MRANENKAVSLVSTRFAEGAPAQHAGASLHLDGAAGAAGRRAAIGLRRRRPWQRHSTANVLGVVGYARWGAVGFSSLTLLIWETLAQD